VASAVNVCEADTCYLPIVRTV